MKLNVLRVSQMIGAAVLLAAGTAAFADDLDDAYAAFQAAAKGEDTAQLEKTALATCAAVKKLEASPAPENPVEKDDFTKRVEWAKSVQVEAEYGIYTAALKAPDATKIELLTALEGENPKSTYMEVGYSVLIGALTQAGESAKVPEVAERAVENFPYNIDALLYLTDEDYRKGQKEKALGYAKKMVAAAGRGKPEELSAPDWDRLKGIALSRGYWYSGVIEAERNQFFPCNADLRLALPLVRGNDELTGRTLFYLGLCNYKIAHETRDKQMMTEAAKFSDEAAHIKSSVQGQAYTNAAAIKGELSKMR